MPDDVERRWAVFAGSVPGPLGARARRIDEILFLDERGEPCEGAQLNLFVRSGGRLTPPLSCGLLPGTLRAYLLGSGEAEELVLRLGDLTDASKWFLSNSVRGLIRSRLIAEGIAKWSR